MDEAGIAKGGEIMRWRLAALLLGLGASLVALTVYAAARRDTASVRWFSDASAVPGASSSLLRIDNGVSMTLHTSQLAKGDVVTIWWVVFNNPEECAAGVPGIAQCGEPDLFNPDVQASVLHAAGHPIGGSETASFGAHLSVGDTDDALFGPGLLDPLTAEVHLVVRSHGPLIPGLVNEQSHTFDGGCNPGPNACTDLQFSVHQP